VGPVQPSTIPCSKLLDYLGLQIQRPQLTSPFPQHHGGFHLEEGKQRLQGMLDYKRRSSPTYNNQHPLCSFLVMFVSARSALLNFGLWYTMGRRTPSGPGSGAHRVVEGESGKVVQGGEDGINVIYCSTTIRPCPQSSHLIRSARSSLQNRHLGDAQLTRLRDCTPLARFQ
jgi:hypothetical protein